jgi:5,10-methylenetetrahydromethanopterin reductase
MPPRFGIGLRSDRPLPEFGRLARLAEELGFDVVSVFADLGYPPPLPPLLAAAAATRRVRLGPACLNPYTTHPVEIAAQALALDAASNGRAYIGLAKGAWLASIGMAQPRPVAAVREAAEVVRGLLAGRKPIPLLIGGWGPRMSALAGEIADELKVGGSANPDLVPVMLTRLREGAAAAGRRPGSTGLVMGAVAVVDENGDAARDRARSAVAMYFEVVASLDPTLDVAGDLIERVGERLGQGDERGAGRLIPDELLDRFAFAGTPVQVARQVKDLFDAGASRVEFGSPFGLEAEQGLRLLGERVLPEFR